MLLLFICVILLIRVICGSLATVRALLPAPALLLRGTNQPEAHDAVLAGRVDFGVPVGGTDVPRIDVPTPAA
jgi:hypothetical protein